MKTLAIAALAACVAVAAPAAGATWAFSYTASTGAVLSGIVQGTLHIDNDTIIVSSFSNTAMTGEPSLALPYLNSLTRLLSIGTVPAFVSLSGTVMDVVACDTAACNDGFVFSSPISPIIPGPAFSTGVSYGALPFETYVAANWSISAVPEVSSWAMLIAGFGLTGAVMRRRRIALAA